MKVVYKEGSILWTEESKSRIALNSPKITKLNNNNNWKLEYDCEFHCYVDGDEVVGIPSVRLINSPTDVVKFKCLSHNILYPIRGSHFGLTLIIKSDIDLNHKDLSTVIQFISKSYWKVTMSSKGKGIKGLRSAPIEFDKYIIDKI